MGGALALDECYFEPLSSCSLRDAYGPDVEAAWGRFLKAEVLDEARKRLHGSKVYFNAVDKQNHTYGEVPPQVRMRARSRFTGVLCRNRLGLAQACAVNG
jgi:hypothetical protein